MAQMKMILKPGKIPEDPKSYRPITLLLTTSKILESLILARLKPEIENRSLDINLDSVKNTIQSSRFIDLLTKYISLWKAQDTVRLLS